LYCRINPAEAAAVSQGLAIEHQAAAAVRDGATTAATDIQAAKLLLVWQRHTHYWHPVRVCVGPVVATAAAEQPTCNAKHVRTMAAKRCCTRADSQVVKLLRLLLLLHVA
jgi:hypothetical protein